jgi:hypothetical protein
MDIPLVLSNYYKGQSWSLNGSGYNGLLWSDENTLSKPSEEELTTKYEELVAAHPLKELRTKRNTRLSETDKYATIDYPHGSDADKQVRLTQRQTLRDLPTLVTPIEGGSMKLWVTNENGPLLAGDGLVASSNVAGYFTKGEPAVVTINKACDFSESTSETYYSNIVSVTQSNVVTTSNTAQPDFTENAYWTSNTVSHYTGSVVSHYSNIVVYDGVAVYSNVDVATYANLSAKARSLYTPVEITETSFEERDGFTPVLRYSNVSADQYDANVYTEYTKVVTHYSNISVIETTEYSNISVAQYEALDTAKVITPGYTSFVNEASSTTIGVQQYAQLTPEERLGYTIVVTEPVTSNLQSYYTKQTKITTQDIKYLDATGAETDEANAIRVACHVECGI